jgi:transcriptional adapter 2-alpha
MSDGPVPMEGLQASNGVEIPGPEAIGAAVGSGSGVASVNGGTSDSKQQSRSKRARSSKADRKEAKNAVDNTGLFHCNYCGRDLSDAVRARCAVCPDYDSCLDCFSVGATLNPHKPDHPYRLIQVCSKPIFEEGWGADEEEKMLEALEQYGVGNWEEVANVIGTKNPLETERHYMRAYLQSNCAPLPDPSRLIPRDKDPLNEDYNDVDPKALRVMHMHQQEDAAGWMSKRGDFVYDWDNEAEEILGDMEIGPDDSRREQDLKLSVLEVYCHKLDERQRRKEFVLERGLTDIKRQQALEKKRSKEERELRDKLRVFARFLPAVEMDKFVKGLLSENGLRTQLEVFREARLAGAKTVEEAHRFAAASSKSSKPSRSSETMAPIIEAKQRVNTPSSQNNRSRARKSVPVASSGSGPGNSDAPPIQDDTVSAATASGAAHSASSGGFSGGASGSQDVRDRAVKGHVLGDVELERMPGAELLSNAEISLCISLKLTPHQYLIVKDVMVRECARVGFIRKKDVRSLIRLDPTKVSKIFDYLLACGWIKHGVSGVAARSAAAALSNSAKR